MSAEEIKGIVINGKVISALVGVFSLAAMLFSGVGYVTYQGFELNQAKSDITDLEAKVDNNVAELRLQIETSDKEVRENYKMILDRFDKLTGEVTKLTIAVGNVQYKQENTQAQR
ncbi:MAG: hypothetical protein EOR25_10780 [Mesorhizobium sp.]|uniref:hypothetical protein n=1 Tax=Mesorhizobium sp. TaxID=1871066 RepID=UPI000FE41428|nr:hypothetical protein [Mesorhizobium sp.]RWH49601.1 MAG: hypothetical protein EOQ80_06750 [Mesorhizobium sp.]RWH52162.1 MAG: hypothetical protein EOQ82_27160 [Mesorhizobium sp.]RWI48407.1 MAG: hypothetical protein EOR15_13675 [Mesorhizobium sp.]RWI64056.1 MAG: hypothetical protein EOR18_30345 [Mesorhizobium sp.]RWI88158.1 MAG: hypothetical protein EOR20_03730 [Mesorhizobium sp.]